MASIAELQSGVEKRVLQPSLKMDAYMAAQVEESGRLLRKARSLLEASSTGVHDSVTKELNAACSALDNARQALQIARHEARRYLESLPYATGV